MLFNHNAIQAYKQVPEEEVDEEKFRDLVTAKYHKGIPHESLTVEQIKQTITKKRQGEERSGRKGRPKKGRHEKGHDEPSKSTPEVFKATEDEQQGGQARMDFDGNGD